MKYLFINPPNRKLRNEVNKAVVPLGLAYISAVLLKQSHEVKILDTVIEGIDNEFEHNNYKYYGLSLNKIRKEIDNFKPDVLGVSCLFTSVSDIAVEICKIAKECGTKYTIIGGPTPSALPEHFAANKAIDFVFLGESENSILEFSISINDNNTDGLKTIDGIVYKDSDNNIVHQPKQRFITNLDDIAFPARHLLPMEKYFKISSPQGGIYKSTRSTPIMTSRGCTAKCAFCSSTKIWGNKYRYRSAANVIAELEHLKKEYKIEEFQVQDDNFTFNKQRTLDICDKLKGMNLHWSMPNGIALWSLDEERIKAMSESGCHYVIAAIESGNQRVITKVMGKPVNLEKILEICRLISQYKITLAGFFIIGFPDETLEDVKDTFRFALKCNLQIAGFNYATPLPGTRLWKQAEDKNLFIREFDLTNITYDRPSLKSRNWTVSELQSLVLSLSRNYYLKTFLKRPTVILFRMLDAFKRNPAVLCRIIYYRIMRK
ncbi:B12-binding domain-containing radical SAM protein [bacterium]|nr:B12-binding domain-containing radical SAM protein [bacterium]